MEHRTPLLTEQLAAWQAASTDPSKPIPLAPVHLPRAKADARHLAQWTGEPLSTCQELTARALGHTTWQALVKNPYFVSTKSLMTAGVPREVREQRQEHVACELADELDICVTLSRVLLSAWQPFSEVPSSSGVVGQAGMFYKHMASNPYLHGLKQNIEPKDLDQCLLHDLGPHPSMPPGYTLAITAGAGQAARELNVIKPGRMALFMRSSDCIRAWDATGMCEKKLGSEDRSRFAPDQLERLKDFYRGAKEIKLPGKQLDDVQAPVAPPKIKARWLREPIPVYRLRSEFAALRPWSAEKYLAPGALPSATWAMRIGDVLAETTVGLGIPGAADNGSVAMRLHLTDPSRTAEDGPAHTVDYLTYEMMLEHHSEPFQLPGAGVNKHIVRTYGPGSYVFNHGSRPGVVPVLTPGLSKDGAERISDEALLSNRECRHNFYHSNAGLAHASWVASRSFAEMERLLEIENIRSVHRTEWLDGACQRMLFELARAHRIDD